MEPMLRMSRLMVFPGLALRVLVVCGALVCAWGAGGCVIIVLNDREDLVDGNRDTPPDSTSARTAGEPNDDFDDALVAVFDESNQARLQGVIETFEDVDVFDLGPLRAGDRIIVAVSTAPFETKLDSRIGLFDADQNLFIQNDNTEVSFDPTIDEIVRHDSDAYYLVVYGTVVSRGDGPPLRRSGPYLVDIEVVPGNAVPAPRAQTVFLDFDGGTIDGGVFSDVLESPNVPPFDAADVNPEYAGQTEALKTLIVDGLDAVYADFNVTFVTSDETDAPEEPFSTVFIGGGSLLSGPARGRAESTDPFNVNPTELAVVSVGFVLSITSPFTVDDIGVVFTNVAAHEVGHLLGLSHAFDFGAVMTGGTSSFPRIFNRAPLSPEFFPIGFQDARLLLSETVGVR